MTTIRGFSVKYPYNVGIVELMGEVKPHRKGGEFVWAEPYGCHLGQDFFTTEGEAIEAYTRWFEEKRDR